MTKDKVLKLALDFVTSIHPAFICEATHHKKNEQHASNEPCPHVGKQKQTYEAIKEALAQHSFDYKDLYEKEKRHSAMWLAKYEEVAGPVPYAVPVAQPEQEPLACVEYIPCCTDQTCSKCKAATPPQRKPLTEQEIGAILEDTNAFGARLYTFARAIEAAHGIKGEE